MNFASAALLQSLWAGAQTVLAFLIVLGLAVFLHEAGHFLAAKAFGIRVLEFAFGFPPKRLASIRRNETDYSIYALPLGGFVRLAGMEPGEDAGPDGFNNRPVWQRMAVYIAGPFMNFVLAAIVFVGMGVTVGVPVRGYDAAVAGVMDRQPAQAAGFQKDDHVLAIDGRRVDMEGMLKTVHASAGKQLTFTVKRGEQEVRLKVTPRATENGNGQIGVQLQVVGSPEYRRVGVVSAMAYGADTTWKFTRETVAGIGRMFHDREARKGVAGPVGIMRMAGDALKAGAITFFTFLAIISVNLGVLNLLPLLVVDGGHIALLALEWIRGKKLQPSLQISIQVVGMVLILLAAALLTVYDIHKWVTDKPF